MCEVIKFNVAFSQLFTDPIILNHFQLAHSANNKSLALHLSIYKGDMTSTYFSGAR